MVGSTGAAPNPWLFAGQFYDSAHKLYKMGERYYDPAVGRFTQRDPVPHLGDPAQQNPYAYAADDPVNLTDPTGADCVSEITGATAAILGIVFIIFTPGLPEALVIVGVTAGILQFLSSMNGIAPISTCREDHQNDPGYPNYVTIVGH